jgi:hypothetical protein
MRHERRERRAFLSSWPAEPDAERWNLELMAVFANRFPEYSAVFAGSVVDARERDGNRFYRSVDPPASRRIDRTEVRR